MKGRKGCRVGNKTTMHHGDGHIPAFSAKPAARGKVTPSEVPILGKISRMRLDRPGRKRGGACGAELSPLSMAAKSE
jgi:hypothetical protein